MYAYPECYLSDAMRNLGEYIEYAIEEAKIDPDDCIPMLIISDFASAWEKGDPRVVSGMSGIELFSKVSEKCGLDLSKTNKTITRYDTGDTYWSGYILAYYQWHTSDSFSKINSKIHLSEILRLYPALHTASEEKGIEIILDMTNETHMISRLQAYRKRLGLSQRQLADLSGVNVRTLQQYEIGDKDINKASAEKVISLSKVLHCQPDDLLA